MSCININKRKEYLKGSLNLEDLLNDPILQLKIWFNEAVEKNIDSAEAACLSTSDKNNFPNSRIILIKNINNNGLIFYTNYESQKALEIKNNPQAALLFFWPTLERQVRVKGLIKKTSEEDSMEYFAQRPKGSQLAAAFSRQSQKVISNINWQEEYKIFLQKNERKEIACPPHWGGYILQPIAFEFWQGRENRLHDRFLYEKNTTNSWQIHRLFP